MILFRHFAALAFALSILIGSAFHALAWYEPARGSAERADILDAIRPAVESQMGGPVVFVIRTFRVIDGWAFVAADPQRPGGKAISFDETRFAGDEAFMDGLTVYALTRWSNKRWNLIVHIVGPTDVAYEPWPEAYGAPREIFGF